MYVKKKIISALTVALSLITGFPCLGADEAKQQSEDFRTVSFHDWMNVDVFNAAEKKGNADSCSLEAFKEAFPTAEGADEKGRTTYKGVSDIAYITAFNNNAYVLLVQACGSDPSKFDGSTWSFPGGRNDKTPPTIAALREGEEETAKLFTSPSGEPELAIASQNMILKHFQNPHPRFKDVSMPMSLAVVPVKAGLNWRNMFHNFELAARGYAKDMEEKGRPAPHHEKQNGAWVLLKEIIDQQSHSMPKENVSKTFTIFNPLSRTEEQQVLLIRKSGIYPFLTFEDARNALQMVGEKVAGYTERKAD